MSEPRIVECESIRLRGKRWLRVMTSGWISALLFLGSCTAGLAMVGAAGILFAMIVTALAQALPRALDNRKTPGGRVLLVEEGIHVFPTNADSALVPRQRVAFGFEEPSTGSVVFGLDDGREISLALPADEDPDELLEHMGVGPARRSLTLPLRGTIGAGTWAFLGLMLGTIAAMPIERAFRGGPLVALAVMVASAIALGVWLGRPRVTIGADGIRVRGGLGARFVPFSEVERVEWLVVPGQGGGGGVIRIVTKGGPLDLPLYGVVHTRVEALRHNIEQAARRHAGGGARKIVSLARAGRTIDEWRTEMKRVASADAGFRDAALGPADFERILADASAPPDERIGAAMALRVASPEAAPEKIRVAIETSADEAFREGLGATLDEDEDEAALERATQRRGG